MTALIVISLALLNSAGQIFLAKAVKAQRKYLYLIAGYTLFVLSVVCVQYLMHIIDFKTLSIITSFNVIGVLIASVIFLGERLTKRKVLGSMVVFAGSAIYFLA